MNRDQVLTQAGELINGQRAQDYGDPSKNFADIAALWSPIFGQEVRPWQVALAMGQVKVARILKTPTHEDSWVDGIGYLALGSELAAEEVEAGETILATSCDVLVEKIEAGRIFRVGDEVHGDNYEALPVGTVVDDPSDPSEGLLTREEGGLWSEDPETMVRRTDGRRLPQIVSLPGGEVVEFRDFNGTLIREARQ